MAENRLPRALLDPQAVFATPAEVAAAPDLEREQQIEILHRWMYDQHALAVATEENMPGAANNDLLEQIVQELHQLGSGPDLDHAPPTKYGAV